MESIKNSIVGFFKIVDIYKDEKLFITYPVVEVKDLLTNKRYNLLDKLLGEEVVKHDIVSGILIPYSEDSDKTIYIVDGVPPLIYPPMEFPFILELIKSYCKGYEKNIKKLFKRKVEYSKILRTFPAIIYLVAVHYFMEEMTRPLPKLVNCDKEEIVFSNFFLKQRTKLRIKRK